jgi:hypothetical protein
VLRAKGGNATAPGGQFEKIVLTAEGLDLDSQAE